MHISIKPALFILGISLCGSSHGQKPVWNSQFGSESTDSLAITLDLRDRIRISNLQNIYLSKNPSGSYAGGTGACVYRNSGSYYNVTASGNNGGFFLSNQVSKFPYLVYYSDGQSLTLMRNGFPLSNRKNADNRAPDCHGTSNAYIHVSVEAKAINSVPAGHYTGILTLLVAPL